MVVEAALDADLFVFLGDLSDPDTAGAFAAQAYACEVASRLASAGVPSCWIVGNHDTIEDGRGTSTLSAIAGFERGKVAKSLIRVFEQPAAELISNRVIAQGLAFVALPYPNRALPYDPQAFASKLQAPPDGVPVLVAGHLWIHGAPEDGSESTDMQRGRGVYWPVAELRKQLPSALLVGGHYHKAGLLGGVQIAGSLERLTFGEEQHDPQFLILEV